MQNVQSTAVDKFRMKNDLIGLYEILYTFIQKNKKQTCKYQYHYLLPDIKVKMGGGKELCQNIYGCYLIHNILPET